MTPHRKRHRKVFEYPWCIYCGGIAPATEADHVPARVMFEGRARPKGLEFPSCKACNEGVRRSELVAALISRANSEPGRQVVEQEFGYLLKAVHRHVPGLLEEMRSPRAQSKLLAKSLGLDDDAFIRLGPIANAHLNAFAAKFGFAFHFLAKGTPVPVGGAVAVCIRSNVDLLKGRIPSEIFELFGAPQTLQQGRFSAEDQFRYKALGTDDGNMSMGIASFRRSFAILTFAGDDPAKLSTPSLKGEKLFKPGDLALKHEPEQSFPRISVTWRSQ